MRRYTFLSKDGVYGALNKLRAAFLAAKNGEEVDLIIFGVLTQDERLKVGRRIQIAQKLQDGMKYREIADELKVGLNTVEKVHTLLNTYPACYQLINRREEKVEKEYNRKAFVKTGGPKLVYKKTEHTGFKRKNVKR